MKETPESRLCSKCGKPLTVLGGWVVKRGGTLVCKECDFKDVKTFKPVRCPQRGNQTPRGFQSGDQPRKGKSRNRRF